MSEQSTFKYSITSEDFARWFRVKDIKVKKNTDGSYELINEDDFNNYILDCYTTPSDIQCCYNLHWRINAEKSDIDEKTSNHSAFKRLFSEWNVREDINTSSPFAYSSMEWETEEEDEE